MPEVLPVPRGWAFALLVTQLARCGAASREPTSGPQARRAARPSHLEQEVVDDAPSILALVHHLQRENEGLLGESPPEGMQEISQEAKEDFADMDSAIREDDTSIVKEIAKEVKREVRVALGQEVPEENNDLSETGARQTRAAHEQTVGASKGPMEAGTQKKGAQHRETAKKSKGRSGEGASALEKDAWRIRVTPQGKIIDGDEKETGVPRRDPDEEDVGRKHNRSENALKDRAKYLKAVKDALKEGNLTKARDLATELVDHEKAKEAPVTNATQLATSSAAANTAEQEDKGEAASKKVAKESLEDLHEAIEEGDLKEARDLADKAYDVLQGNVSQAVLEGLSAIQAALTGKDLEKAAALLKAILKEFQPKNDQLVNELVKSIGRGDLGSARESASKIVAKGNLLVDELLDALWQGDMSMAREAATKILGKDTKLVDQLFDAIQQGNLSTAPDVLNKTVGQAAQDDVSLLYDAINSGDMEKAQSIIAKLDQAQQAQDEDVTVLEADKVLERLREAVKMKDSGKAAQLAAQAQEQMHQKAEQVLRNLSVAPLEVQNAELVASNGLKECALKGGNPQDMLQQLRDCTSSLHKFAKVTENVMSLSRASNEAYRRSLDKVSLLLAKIGDAPSMAAALERDQAKARQYLLNEADKLYASIDSIRQPDLE